MLGTEERRALYVPLEDKAWAYIGPSPTWDSDTGLFVGYRVGLYDEKYNIVSFEERLFPITKDIIDRHGETIRVTDLDAWMEFVFPIQEWEAQRNKVIKLLEDRQRR